MTECIHGPREGHGHAGVKDVDTYRAVHRAAMHHAEKTVQENSDPVAAVINHGRWVVNCACHGAGLSSPEFGCTCCFDCGTVYTQVIFPDHAADIERLLLARPEPASRNWTGETVAELTTQNKDNL